MNYWSFQKQEVLDVINKEGVFFPDFSYKQNPSYLNNSYNLALGLFKRYNPSFADSNGVVFSFDRDIDNPFQTAGEIKEFFRNGTMAQFIRKADDQTPVSNYKLLQLANYHDINTVPVDIALFVGFSSLDISIKDGALQFNQFQAESIFGKSGEYIFDMLSNWFSGNYSGPMYQGPIAKNILQHHLPFIKKENIVEVLPAEDFFLY